MPEEYFNNEIGVENLLRMTSDEVLESIHIIDIGPKHIDRINSNNVHNVIEAGKKELVRVRKEANAVILKDNPDLKLAYAKIILGPMSAPHAIQCIVNGVEDKREFLSYVEKNDKSGKKSTQLDAFFSTYMDLGVVLESLYEVDIVRRIGEAKNDSTFVKQEMPFLNDMVLPGALKGLKEF